MQSGCLLQPHPLQQEQNLPRSLRRNFVNQGAAALPDGTFSASYYLALRVLFWTRNGGVRLLERKEVGCVLSAYG